MEKGTVFQFSADMDFSEKTVDEMNQIMLRMNSAIESIAKEENVKVITDLLYCWEPTDAYDTVCME